MKQKQASAILRWFSGKSREKVEAMLPRFVASVAEGEWESGLSRSFVAALNKCNVAAKVGREIERDLSAIPVVKPEYPGERNSEARGIASALKYGSWRWDDTAAVIETQRKAARTDEQRAALERAAEVAADFLPVYLAARELDQIRPKPVFTSIGLSPTVTATLTEARLALVPKTVRVCPMEWMTIDTVDKDGFVRKRRVGYLKWPKGTVHGASRFGRWQHQCEACGHGISNPYNWVPFIIDDKAGKPHSLWVGRDCAHNIFGVKVKGELEFVNAEEGKP